jgi:hypothetical protein
MKEMFNLIGANIYCVRVILMYMHMENLFFFLFPSFASMYNRNSKMVQLLDILFFLLFYSHRATTTMCISSLWRVFIYGPVVFLNYILKIRLGSQDDSENVVPL